MISFTEKMPIQILYYIRQVGEISLSDLHKKLFYARDSHRVTINYNFLRYLLNLYDSDFIKIIINDSENSDELDKVEIKANVHEILHSAIELYFLPPKERYKDATNPNDIIISVTNKFNEVQQTIGFSITDAMKQLQVAHSHNSLFGEVNLSTRSNIFVIMPFANEFKPIYEDHIEPVCKELEYSCMRADLIDSPNVIINDIWNLINNSDIIICDCTGKNPNVFYELGLAHSLGKKVICITQNSDDIPFDISAIRYIKYEYNPRGMKEFEATLKRYLTEDSIIK